jgi:hypothetical protein
VHPDVVAGAVWRALTVKKPKTRYLVSNHRILHSLVKFLPDAVVDRLAAEEFENKKVMSRKSMPTFRALLG